MLSPEEETEILDFVDKFLVGEATFSQGDKYPRTEELLGHKLDEQTRQCVHCGETLVDIVLERERCHDHGKDHSR